MTYFKDVKLNDYVLISHRGKSHWELVTEINVTDRGDIELCLGYTAHECFDTRTKWTRHPDAPITMRENHAN